MVCKEGVTCLSSAEGLFLVPVEGTALVVAEAADVCPGTNHYRYTANNLKDELSLVNTLFG